LEINKKRNRVNKKKEKNVKKANEKFFTIDMRQFKNAWKLEIRN